MCDICVSDEQDDSFVKFFVVIGTLVSLCDVMGYFLITPVVFLEHFARSTPVLLFTAQRIHPHARAHSRARRFKS